MLFTLAAHDSKPVTTLFSMLILVNSVRLHLFVIASLIQNASLAIEFALNGFSVVPL